MIAKTVRDGKLVWPYCPTCGCRLDITLLQKSNLALLQHFWHSDEGKDARGCYCENADNSWYLPIEKVNHIGM